MIEFKEHQSFIASMLYLKIEADRLNMPIVTRNLKLAILAAIQELNKDNEDYITETNAFFDKLLSVPVNSTSEWSKLIEMLEKHEKLIEDEAVL